MGQFCDKLVLMMMGLRNIRLDNLCQMVASLFTNNLALIKVCTAE